MQTFVQTVLQLLFNPYRGQIVTRFCKEFYTG
jgi:hypothetical protein